ncbi:MAG: ATPase F0F1 [Rhodospirillaceae bacterium]|nr:ATPase F0F1 [Rhodospirillaceae bacterium]
MRDRDGDMNADQAHMAREVGRKAQRKLKARAEHRHGVWFGLGMFGLVGWSIAVPTLLGAAFGAWLDSLYPGEASWTLTFIIIGVAVGCVIAWRWVKRESRND